MHRWLVCHVHDDLRGGLGPFWRKDLGAAAPDAACVPLSFAPSEALDLNSMDILNFVASLHERTGRPIPEADTPKLLTLPGLVAHFHKTELAH